MDFVSPERRRKISEELNVSEKLELSLSPARLYLLLMVVRAGQTTMRFNDSVQDWFDEWYEPLESDFIERFPEAGSRVKEVEKILRNTL